MLELFSAGQPVHLSPATTVQVETNSPLFDADIIKGSFSYSFSVPAGPNGRVYGWPERPDLGAVPGATRPAELRADGLPVLVGTQRVKTATTAKYSVSVQGGLSGAGLSERLLSSFSYGGLREVPRWVPVPGSGGDFQMPGLVLHANEVVASEGAYPYVFAPLRNEYINEATAALPGFDAKNIDLLNYPYEAVNRWIINSTAFLGLPAGGSFGYNIDFKVPGGVVYGVFTVLPHYCPFPKLRYVLQSICEESGLAVDVAQLLPGELGDLAIVSNALLVDRGDLTALRFSLADVVPELTVAQLLAALRQDFGIVVYVDPLTQRVRSCYLAEQVAPGAAFVDWSTRLAGAAEVTLDDAAGLTLSPHVDGDDELTKDLLSKQPDPALVLPAVATVADLPATAVLLTANPQDGQVRQVLATATYYTCTLSYLDGVSVTLTWTPLVVALPPVAVLGGGEVQEQATCYTVERPTRCTSDLVTTCVLPALSQPAFRADQPAGGASASQDVGSRSAALRLLFYNGLQKVSDGVNVYPQLSHQSRSGAYSVRLAGATGTYAQWLKDWLPVQLSPVSYKQPLQLTALDLARLDPARPLRLAGVPFLLRKLTATLPLRKAATAELVRLF